MTERLTPDQERAIERALEAAKNGDLPPEEPTPNVVVINGQPTPLPLAELMVANEQANALTRIADALEWFKARVEKGGSL